MNKEGIQQALDAVADFTGFQLQAESDFAAKNQEIVFRFVGSDNHNSLYFEVQRTPLVWHLRTHFDTFSKQLVQSLISAARESAGEIEAELANLRRDGFEVSFVVRGQASDGTSWADETLEFELHSLENADWRDPTPDKEVNQLADLLRAAVVVIHSLAEGVPSKSQSGSQLYLGDVEGDVSSVQCTRYERSPRNRTACLDYYGFICAACGLKPDEVYGDLGRRIIHIHHLTPLSGMISPGVVDPIADLRPLCPNCHNYAHKRVPPFSPDEIKYAIRQAQGHLE